MADAMVHPAANYVAVTASDTTDLGPVRGIYVGGAGAVAVSTGLTGSGVTFAAVPVGTFMPVACRRIMATNTTATNLVALY